MYRSKLHTVYIYNTEVLYVVVLHEMSGGPNRDLLHILEVPEIPFVF